MPKAQRGFTLLEVLVAFTLLALLFGALFQVFAGGLSLTRSGETQSRAVLLAKSKLAEIGADQGIGPGTHSGIFDLNARGGPRYRWRAELSRYSEDALGRADRGELVPYRVDLELIWDADKGERSLTLSSLVLRPK
ncbi:MAG: prepilin-type N-terminal cleavage/methylation domain-containing protein [Gammaproteobacteria bacterium]|nr:prepilin-type N-terminal cleavage/methylation domain-containing protein [Gammaproteobacteria bacterium]MDH3413620.1 prepilin-type N-terminal cleavage/methylation domain-containing protein [Gammaproteobacteria bacterium]